MNIYKQLSCLLYYLPVIYSQLANCTTQELTRTIPETSLLTLDSENSDVLLCQKIDELLQTVGTIKLIFGDQGNDRFTLQFNGLVFVDPLVNKNNPVYGKNHIFVRSTVSDFLSFIGSLSFPKLLEKKVNFVFDDWSILTHELEYSYGTEDLTAKHPLTFEEKIDILWPLLSQDAKIFISTNFFSEHHWSYLSIYYSKEIHLCGDNARAEPHKCLSDEIAFSLFPYWVIAPRDFALNQKSRYCDSKSDHIQIGTVDRTYLSLLEAEEEAVSDASQQREMVNVHAAMITLYEDIMHYYYANEKFGERFVAIKYETHFEL
jgi:hypothetical protein